MENFSLSQIYELATLAWRNFQFHNGEDSDNLLAKRLSKFYRQAKCSKDEKKDEMAHDLDSDDFIDDDLLGEIEQLIELPYLGMMQVV